MDQESFVRTLSNNKIGPGGWPLTLAKSEYLSSGRVRVPPKIDHILHSGQASQAYILCFVAPSPWWSSFCLVTSHGSHRRQPCTPLHRAVTCDAGLTLLSSFGVLRRTLRRYSKHMPTPTAHPSHRPLGPGSDSSCPAAPNRPYLLVRPPCPPDSS